MRNGCDQLCGFVIFRANFDISSDYQFDDDDDDDVEPDINTALYEDIEDDNERRLDSNHQSLAQCFTTHDHNRSHSFVRSFFRYCNNYNAVISVLVFPASFL